MKKVKFVQVPKEENRVDEELGILYPNGDIDWAGRGLGHSLGNIYTLKERRDVQQRYNEMCVSNHSPGGKLRFVKRTITTSFSVPVISKISQD